MPLRQRPDLRQRASLPYVDGLSTNRHYVAFMRQVFLTIFLAIALGVSGIANAAAARECPMLGMAQMDHDCCPENGGENGAPSDDDSKGMKGCAVGMPCRSAPAVTPSLEPIRLQAAAIPLPRLALGEPAPPPGPLDELFRPPRRI